MDSFRQAQLQRDFVPDFSDGPKQKQSRPPKANSAAGTIALALLRGERLSVQDAIKVLAAAGITSNDTARRMREAVTWLLNKDCSVNKRLQSSANGISYHFWYISVIGAYQNQLTNLIKGIK